MKHLILLSILSITALGYGQTQKTDPLNQEEELGLVSWYRKYKTAQELSKDTQKPIFLLFQEVPGCGTCKRFGNDVLGNPLISEAIEQFFIPLLIHNNKGGEDRATLDQFNERAWNNPVARIVDHNGKDLQQKLNGVYSPVGVWEFINKYLITHKIKAPRYFELLGQELNSNTATSQFNMYCFWSGEKDIGAIDGVISTVAFHSSNGEGVEVVYDPDVVSEALLTEKASKHKCNKVRVNDDVHISQKDHLFYLKKTKYQDIPLSEVQKTKVNSYVGLGKNPNELLSPKQLLWLQTLGHSPFQMDGGMNFKGAWVKLMTAYKEFNSDE